MDSIELPDEFILGGVVFHGGYSEENIRKTTDFQSRDDDIFLSTYPRSGTTWTQNIMLGLKHGLSYLQSEDTTQDRIDSEFVYLELPFPAPGYEMAADLSSPRLLKTHLPSHLAPKDIFSLNRKNVVVIRNPKDVALSIQKFYLNNDVLKPFNKFKDLEDFLDHFLEGKIFYGSWWEWNKGWLEKSKKCDNIHFIHYEDWHDHFEAELDKLTSFLNFDLLADEDKEQLKKLVSVDQMKQKYSNDPMVKNFVDKGRQATWKKEMPEVYAERFDAMTKKYFDGDEILARLL